MWGVPGMDKWYARYKKKEEYWLKHGKMFRGKVLKVRPKWKHTGPHEYRSPEELKELLKK